jgi:hypothetical protein
VEECREAGTGGGVTTQEREPRGPRSAANVGGNVMLGHRAGLQVDGEGAASSETGTPRLLPCKFA